MSAEKWIMAVLVLAVVALIIKKKPRKNHQEEQRIITEQERTRWDSLTPDQQAAELQALADSISGRDR